MKVLAVTNLKGGVGKTAAAANLAFLAARDGLATLLWDLDAQAAASDHFRVQPKAETNVKDLLKGRLEAADLVRATDFPGLDLLPADLSYRRLDRALAGGEGPRELLASLLLPLEAEYDLVILDAPPGLGRLTEAIFVAADALLVPTVPTPLSLRALASVADFLDRKRYRRLQLLPFYSLVDRRKSLHREIVDGPPRHPGMLRTVIPYASAVEQMAARRLPVAVFAGGSPGARAFEELWSEVRERVGV